MLKGGEVKVFEQIGEHLYNLEIIYPNILVYLNHPRPNDMDRKCSVFLGSVEDIKEYYKAIYSGKLDIEMYNWDGA